MQHSRIACLHTLYSCLRRVYAKFRKPLSALFSPSPPPSSVALSYNPTKKSYDSEFDVKSVFRKKSDNSLRGGRGTRYPASYISPRTIESRTSVVLKFVIFFYIYNCPFVPYIFRYNFFNDAFMTRSTRFPRYAIHTVYYRNESKQV